MEYLNINVTNVRNKLVEEKTCLNDYKTTLDEVCTNFKSVNKCWTDDNTEYFLETLQDDVDDFEQHYNSLSSYLKNVEEFCDDLESSVKSSFSIGTLSSLRYSKSTVTNAKNSLNTIKSSISTLKNNMAYMSVPVNTGYSSIIHNLLDGLDLSDIVELKEKINKFESNLNKVQESARTKVNGIDYTNVNRETFVLNYKPVRASVKKTNALNEAIRSDNKHYRTNNDIDVDIDDTDYDLK